MNGREVIKFDFQYIYIYIYESIIYVKFLNKIITIYAFFQKCFVDFIHDNQNLTFMIFKLSFCFFRDLHFCAQRYWCLFNWSYSNSEVTQEKKGRFETSCQK